MFYHSRDWGFDTSAIEKKEKAKEFLNRIGLPCCIKHICNHSEVNAFFRKDNKNCYLVMVLDTESLKYTGFFNIISREQLLAQIDRIVNDDFCMNRLRYCFIEQMHEFIDCFTANIISDGKGNAIIEYIQGTVDNRCLSSGGIQKTKPQKIVFNDYKMVFCDNYKIFMLMWESIKTCLFFKGYYECSYALVNEIKDVFFSYYSDEEIYQNITLDYIDYDIFKYRCAFLSMVDI